MSLSFTHLVRKCGNATLVESGDCKEVIDQGFLESNLKQWQNEINQEIDAIVITHHHGDHGGGASLKDDGTYLYSVMTGRNRT